MANLKDSGERTHYASGAVRDCKEGKGRFDLMPLDVLHGITGETFYLILDDFRKTGYVACLYQAIGSAGKRFNWEDPFKMLLEVAIHFEDGAKKYGESNWKKGIPLHSYIDSACRHFTKYQAGWTDEPHDRACIWNLMCAVWTYEHMHNLDDFTEPAKTDDSCANNEED